MNFKEDAQLMKALADENCLEILSLLKGGQKCGCVLLEKLNITQPTLSHHMKILCEVSLVDSYKEGKWRHYSLSREGSKKIQEFVQRYTAE